MRLFVALVPPESLRRDLDAALAPARDSIRGRWVPWENLHFTLAFLGEVDGAQLPEVTEAVSRAVAHHAPCFVELGGLAELRINHQVLSPVEIVAARRELPDSDHVPFADNHCGDLYCWRRKCDDEPEVWVWDHELREYELVNSSFTEWLRENRF